MAKKDAKTEAKSETEAQFGIQRVYIKDASFEAPNSPQVFLEQWKPEMDMNIDTKTTKLEDNTHEVVLTVTANVKIKDKTIFIAEVQQAGIFTIQNFPEDQLKRMLGSFCPNILYPYAREAVTGLVIKGGFPQLYLAPVNFDAIYMQQQEKKGGAAGANA